MTSHHPRIWIVATGSEILQGHYTDRNSPWLSARLKERGLRTARHLALPDDTAALEAGFAEARAGADLVISTGGLGPTADDLNREAVARVWGRELIEAAAAIAMIESRLRHVGRQLLPANRVQALIPRGARIVANENGTAPGFFIPSKAGAAALLALPGPPRENQPMFASELPALLEALHWTAPPLHTAVFRTAGLPEAVVNERLEDLFGSDPNADLAMLFTIGSVDVRLTLTGVPVDQHADLIDRWRQILRDRLGPENIYAEGTSTQAQMIGRLLHAKSQTVAVAESCTGGLIAAALIDPPGASQWFREGIVAYANAAKTARLGVSSDLIDRCGAVSAEVAEAMALGMRRTSAADWGLSVTGIAGPGGGTESKPVGLIWFGLARPDGSAASVRRRMLGGREEIRLRAAQTAQDILRRALIGAPLDPRP